MKTKRLCGIVLLMTILFCLTACGGKSTVSVTYKDPDGNVLSEIDVSSGSEIVLQYTPDTGYKVSKYTFEDGKTAAAKITVNDDIIIIVYIAPISYTITFDSGLYDDSIEVPEDINCKYDEDVTLPKNEISNGTKRANGWRSNFYVAPDYTDYAYYEDGKVVKNLANYDGAKVKLVANFRDAEFTVKFGTRYDSVTDSYTYTTYYYDKDELITANPQTPAKYGYTFGGWYDESDTTKTIVDLTTYKVTKSVTFIPKWEQFSYKVTFKTDIGTAPADLVITTDSGITDITSGDYKLSEPGYDFGGWADAEGKVYGNFGSAIVGYSEDIELTAVWTKWTGTLKFWSEYYGSGKMDSVAVSYGEEIKLPKNTFSAMGYKFIGWGLSSDNENVDFVDCENYTWKGSKNGETVLLIARWIQTPLYVYISTSDMFTNDDITISFDEENYCLRANYKDVTEFTWVIDGVWSEEDKFKNKQAISVSCLKEGVHSITAYCWPEGLAYSSSIIVNVSK